MNTNTVVTVNNWTLFYKGSAYTAPELRSVHLHGLREGDTGNVITSPILRIENGIVETRSGSLYRLGTASAVWDEYVSETAGLDHALDMDQDALRRFSMPGDVFSEKKEQQHGDG